MFSSITSVTAMPDEDLEDYSLEDLRSENSALREKLKETFLLLSGDSARNREYDSVARELEIEKNHTKSLANTVRDLERELAKCNARLLKANLDAVNGVPLKTRIRQLSTTINDQTRELNTLKRDHEENVREKINIISDNQSLKSVLIAEKNRIEFLEKGKAQLEEDYKGIVPEKGLKLSHQTSFTTNYFK